ncbi:glycosyltransferase family 2 protein [Roseisolibacter agri]|uniref:Glycosyltransferase YkcC n=1 Tax=Roseisolibacter agri TaxID=2014610 RepID=A0AA37VC14_9BACT|nr:glycosyltransferase family 2 protein [Roseisolibacter agri]GLC27163.1 putative glycosyltransferase YkcC [Roseisolibacter agri]
MHLSIVVPCYNEEKVIAETHRRLVAVLRQGGIDDYELLYVDDGSRDETATILGALQATDPQVRVLLLSRNFGHQIAISAGIEHASGDAVVLIDADLQDPPEVVLEMVQRWREGFDVAYGVRVDRLGETAFKRATAKIFYRALNRFSDTEIPLDVGDFRLMDRAVVDALISMPERARFIRGMVSWVGFKQVAVPYTRAPRFAGETKYPLVKMLRLAVDGLTSFSLVPLRLASWVGILSAGIALLGVIFAIATRLLTDRWVPGWAALFVAVTFFGGIQLLALGVVGEYVGRIYAEAKRRPLYLLRSRLGFESDVPTPRQGRALPEPARAPRPPYTPRTIRPDGRERAHQLNQVP